MLKKQRGLQLWLPDKLNAFIIKEPCGKSTIDEFPGPITVEACHGDGPDDTLLGVGMKCFFGAAGAAAMALMAAAPASAATMVYSGTGFAIPDLGSPSSTITVAPGSTITNVTFTLNGLSHTYMGDLIGTLTHNGVVFTWQSLGGGLTDLGGIYTFSDSVRTKLMDGPGDPKASGTYRGINLLSAFNGMNSGGEWRLDILDRAGADVGNLDSWSLTISGVPEPATWGMMILGFGAVGAAVRRRNVVRTTVRFA